MTDDEPSDETDGDWMWKLPDIPDCGTKLRLHADKSCIHLQKASADPIRVNPDGFEGWRRCDVCTDREQAARTLEDIDPDEVFDDD